MSKQSRAKRHNRRKRNGRCASLAHIVPVPPAEKAADEQSIEQLSEQLRTTDNVKDVPLGLLHVHPVHGDRDPFKDTTAGLNRRKRCEAHIRESGGWNSQACEVLTVCERESGDGYDVINGVGRLYMASSLSGGTVQVLPCRVLKRLTISEIEKVFAIMGTQLTKISPYDVWRSKEKHRGAEGDEVRYVVGIQKEFGKNLPRLSLSVIQYGARTMQLTKPTEPCLRRAVTLVSNTSFGVNRRYSSIFTSMTVALLASQRNFDEARFRTVAGTGDMLNEHLSLWLYERAQRKANTMGYSRPHERVVAWVASLIFADEMYNKGLPQTKRLDVDALSKEELCFGDAFSNRPPKPKAKKFGVIKNDEEAAA